MAPLHIDRGMPDILTGRADGYAICGSLGPRDLDGVDVVAEASVDRVAQRAIAGHVAVLDAGHEDGLHEVRALLGLRAGGERARVAGERVEQGLDALELGVVEPRARLAGVEELA